MRLEVSVADIKLDLEDAHQLAFSIEISGDKNSFSGETPTVRLVCETKEGYSYNFSGEFVGKGEVEVTIPKMLGRIQPGELNACLEVVVDGKFFKPLTFGLGFSEPMNVVAEHKVKNRISHKPITKEETEVSVSIKETNESSSTKGLKVKKLRG